MVSIKLGSKIIKSLNKKEKMVLQFYNEKNCKSNHLDFSHMALE